MHCCCLSRAQRGLARVQSMTVGGWLATLSPPLHAVLSLCHRSTYSKLGKLCKDQTTSGACPPALGFKPSHISIDCSRPSQLRSRFRAHHEMRLRRTESLWCTCVHQASCKTLRQGSGSAHMLHAAGAPCAAYPCAMSGSSQPLEPWCGALISKSSDVLGSTVRAALFFTSLLA